MSDVAGGLAKRCCWKRTKRRTVMMMSLEQEEMCGVAAEVESIAHRCLHCCYWTMVE